MMIYLVVTMFAASVALLVFAVAQALPARSRLVTERLAELERVEVGPFSGIQRRKRQARRERVEELFRTLGDRVGGASDEKVQATQKLLVQAGYRGENALAIYRGLRVGLPIILAGAMLLVLPAFGARLVSIVLAMVWAAAIGYVVPAFIVGRRAKARKHEIQKALADALDLLVVCVEAGLGLNQAFVRVADEITHVSPAMNEELMLTNLEIRAGSPREEALRNLAERTGIEDLRSLITILIQTDRFGTSVAQALRVQSETLRTKRRQRAEEAAAKSTIKLVFPLAICIFPAMFVVILGPAMIQIMAALSDFA